MNIARQNPVLRRIGVYSIEVSDEKPRTIQELIDKLDKSTGISPASKRQYKTQFYKVADCVAYTFGIGKSKACDLGLHWFTSIKSRLLKDEQKELKAYIDQFMIAAHQSDSTIKAFLDAWLILGDLAHFAFPMLGDDFPKEAMRMLFDIYDTRVQRKAVDQIALLPTQDDIYARIVMKFVTGTRDRALLVMYTYVELRDDLWDSILLRAPADVPADVNYFYFKGESDILFINQKSKTFSEGRKAVHHLPPIVCRELVPYFRAIKWGKYPFGRTVGNRKGGNSQRLIKLMEMMGFDLILQNPDGSKESRGFGVDGFRRLHQTLAEKAGGDRLVEVNSKLGHSAMTSLKYRGAFVEQSEPSEDAPAEASDLGLSFPDALTELS